MQRQFPLEIRVLHIESSRAHYPRDMFVAPNWAVAGKSIVPADPWSEAIKVVAQALSDIFRWGFDSQKYRSDHEARVGFLSIDGIIARWGKDTETEKTRMMWREHERFLSHWPNPIEMNCGKYPEYVPSVTIQEAATDTVLIRTDTANEMLKRGWGLK
jgi:hypothetical protein